MRLIASCTPAAVPISVRTNRATACPFGSGERAVAATQAPLRVKSFQQFWHIKASAVTGHCAIITAFLDVLVMFGSCRINPSWFENVQRKDGSGEG